MEGMQPHRADRTIRSKIASVSWLETGHRAEQLLKSSEAARVESKQDFPETFIDFNCTLNLRLQHNIVDACGHVLSSMDFEERKLLDDQALAAARGLAAGAQEGSADGKDAIARILERAGGASAAPGAASGWTLTADGSWVRLQPGAAGGGGGVDAVETSGLDKILRHARTLSARDADEYLSQEVVQAVLRGGSRAKHSHGLLEAAYNETLAGQQGSVAGGAAGLRDLGMDILKRVSLGQSQTALGGKRGSLEEARPPSGDSGAVAVPRGVSGVAPGAVSSEPWWGEAADEEALEGMEVVALGGWDGSRNLGSFESIRPKESAWQVKGMLNPKPYTLHPTPCTLHPKPMPKLHPLPTPYTQT